MIVFSIRMVSNKGVFRTWEEDRKELTVLVEANALAVGWRWRIVYVLDQRLPLGLRPKPCSSQALNFSQ